MKWSAFVFGWCIALICGAGWGDEPKPLLERLIEQGVDVGGSRHVRLPQPTMPDGLPPAEQQARLGNVADETHPLAALLRKAVVAPFVLKISDENPSPGVAPRRVDLWFVAYGDLARLDNDTLLGQLDAGTVGDNRAPVQAKALAADELQAHSISAEADEKFFAVEGRLFDRVQLAGVMRAHLARTGESIVLAAEIDPRFNGDPRHPNQWQPLLRDDTGKLTVGKPQPYTGAGWYVKVTRLIDPAGALLVEYHLVFEEPAGWFNGANLLRSKLPILAQDGVRNFRRKLEQPAP